MGALRNSFYELQSTLDDLPTLCWGHVWRALLPCLWQACLAALKTCPPSLPNATGPMGKLESCRILRPMSLLTVLVLQQQCNTAGAHNQPSQCPHNACKHKRPPCSKHCWDSQLFFKSSNAYFQIMQTSEAACQHDGGDHSIQRRGGRGGSTT